MKQKILLGVILLLLVVSVGLKISTSQNASVGAPLNIFTSKQVGQAPSAGKVLQTDGSKSTWVATSSLGIVGGTSSSTTYTATGTLLDLTGTEFSVNEGTLTNGKICTYVTGTGLVCDYTDIAGSGATTTINGVNGPTFTFSTSSDTNVAIAISPSLQWQISWLGTLASSRIASSSEWTAAYASTTALTPTYIRGLFSETATGLDYASGVISLTSGYMIPTTGASTTWDGKADYSFGANNFSGTGLFTTTGSVNATTTRTTNATTTNLEVTGTFKLFTQLFTDITSFATYVRSLITENITGLTFSSGQLSLDAGYKLLTDTASSTWDTAYADRLKWDGGPTGLVAATGRTSLGLTDTATLASTTFALASHTQATSTITGVFGVPSGGTGATTLTGILIGNGTSPFTTITNSSANWDLAYASTTALTPTYIRGLFSETTTGLDYSNTTGVTSLTTGYIIPTTASSTNYDSFWGTPSTRITAGTGLSWVGNTLNGVATTTNNTWSLLQTFTNVKITNLLYDTNNATGTAGQILSSTGTSTLWITNTGGSGEANTASNIAPGYGLWTDKVGVDLRFKSLIAGTNITMSSTTDAITINASGGSGVTTLNVGFGYLYTATSTDYIQASNFVATSTTASSTFAGAVGIGTTTVPAMLSVVGNVHIRTLTDVTNALSIKNAANTEVLNVDTTATTTLFGLGTSTLANLTATLSVWGDATNSIAKFFSSAGTIAMEILQSGKVRIGSVLGSETKDVLAINGNINTLDWQQLNCIAEGAKKTANIDADITGSVLSTTVGYPCGDFSFIEDNASRSSFSIDSGSGAYALLKPGATGATTTAGDGVALTLTTAFMGVATNTPILQTDMKMVSATSSNYMIGFGSQTGVSADYSAEPTNGCYFIATSTPNWQAKCKIGTSVSIGDTGVSSSSVSYRRFRVELNSTSEAKFFIQQLGGNMTLTNTLTTNIPTTVVNPMVSVAKSTTGTSPSLYVKNIRVWFKDVLY